MADQATPELAADRQRRVYENRRRFLALLLGGLDEGEGQEVAAAEEE